MWPSVPKKSFASSFRIFDMQVKIISSFLILWQLACHWLHCFYPSAVWDRPGLDFLNAADASQRHCRSAPGHQRPDGEVCKAQSYGKRHLIHTLI